MKIWQQLNIATLLIACASLILVAACFGPSSDQRAQPNVSQLTAVAPTPKPDYATIEGLQEFEGLTASRYTLGPGDKVTVTIWAHPEISGPHVVGPDGNIQLPF